MINCFESFRCGLCDSSIMLFSDVRYHGLRGMCNDCQTNFSLGYEKKKFSNGEMYVAAL